MRTTQAKRYARWSAGIAILLSLVVAYVYGTRYWQSLQARGKVPAAVPSSVEQRSEGFSFSKMVGNRTEFTVRALHATEFVEGGRSLLEDVWITAYGGAGERFDNLHTHTCDYLTASERISCSGDVQIELDRAADHAKAQNGPPKDDPRLVHVATSHVFFDHKSGLATTDRPVSFRFSQGEGQGVGFRYETQQGEMQLLSAVELALHQADPSGKTAEPGQVLHLSGSQMTFERDQRYIHLLGPVHARQANFDLVCGKLDVELDEHMYARRLIATEQPVLQSAGAVHISVTADTYYRLGFAHTGGGDCRRGRSTRRGAKRGWRGPFGCGSGENRTRSRFQSASRNGRRRKGYGSLEAGRRRKKSTNIDTTRGFRSLEKGRSTALEARRHTRRFHRLAGLNHGRR